MQFPFTPAALSASARFLLVIHGLIHALVARTASGVMTDAVIRLICARVVEVQRRFVALVAALKAGTWRPRRSPVHGQRRHAPLAPSLRLPRGFAWLVRLMPSDAASCGGQLKAVLDDPELANLLATSPLLVRTIRPLCRMLGVTPPPPPAPVPPPDEGGERREEPIPHESEPGGSATAIRERRPGRRRYRSVIPEPGRARSASPRPLCSGLLSSLAVRRASPALPRDRAAGGHRNG